MLSDMVRILLIEDNPGDARLIREMLHATYQSNLTLEIVSSLEEATEELCEGVGYDVILLDLSLPDSTGLETLLRTHALAPMTAVIVLTGLDDEKLGLQAVKNGAQDYMIKDDVEIKLLDRAIRYAIEREQIESDLRQSREEYRSLIDDVFDTSMVGVLILDSTFTVAWCNEATEIYFGFQREDILGNDKRKLIDDKLKCIFADPDDYSARLLAAYDNQDFTDRFECHVTAGENRQERWLEHWSQPIRAGIFKGGRIEQYTDITERKALEEAEQQQRIFAEALRDIATILTSTLDLDEVLERILANIDGLVEHHKASITLLDQAGARVVTRRSRLKRDTQELVAENLLEIEDASLLQRQLSSRDVIVINDLFAEDEFRQNARKAKVRSYIGVPIRWQNDLIGFMNIFGNQVDGFTEEDIERLRAFAEQCAIAIQNAKIYRQSQELATLEERQRLARDLHDSVSQSLFTVSAMAESALRRWDKDRARAHELVEEVHQMTVTALSEMRILLMELRPDSLTKVGLKQLFEQYLGPIQSRRGFELDLDIAEVPQLPPDVQITFYRIVQESLNNIEKHAKATRVAVSVRDLIDHLELVIHDNGRGFDRSKVAASSLGLGIMLERADAINASLSLESSPGEGTKIILTWPRI